VHCRAGAKNQDYENELTLSEIKDTLANISSFAKPIIILTGGEPLTRNDLYDIARYGTDLGLTMVLATCGQDLTLDTCKKMIKSGIRQLSFSIDGPTSEAHDKFRGQPGSFDKTISSIKTSYEADLPYQINTTISKQNLDQIKPIANLAAELKAVSWHPFFIVPTGRAREMASLELTPEEYKTALQMVYSVENRGTITIKVTCAPEYHKIAGKKTRGCLAGTGFGFISHTGRVQTCGFLDVECGDLRKTTFDFQKIWNESEVFNNLRDFSNYKGQCGSCRDINICGGCRAKVYEASKDYLGEEPNCSCQT